MTTPTEARHNPGQGGHEHLVVLASRKTRGRALLRGGDVIEGTGNSMRSGRAMDSVYCNNVILQDVTPLETPNPGQGGQEHLVVLALWACMATRGDVIERTREFNGSGRATDAVCHDDVILQDVTLRLSAR